MPSITYIHTLTNTGAGPDTLDVGLAFSSQGWATLLDPGPFALSAGASTTVRVQVTAPASSGGLVETTVITAASRAGEATATVTDVTTVPRVYGVSLSPNAAQSVQPGTAYTYTHQLVNTGNATDTFMLSLTTTRGWATLVGANSHALPAAGVVAVQVRVRCPTGQRRASRYRPPHRHLGEYRYRDGARDRYDHQPLHPRHRSGT